MFFDIILLNPQHKARFWYAWIAATRGIKALNKKQINQVNIVKLSTEIMKYLQNESGDPSKRFSLRLSAILVHGTLKLYREQVILCHSEIIHFLTAIHFHPVLISMSEFESPLTPPIKKPKKKRGKKMQETPESLVGVEHVLLPELQQPLIFPEATKARLDEITLREDGQPKVTEMSVLADDFAESVLAQPTDQPIERPRRSKSPESPEAIATHIITVTAQVHAEAGEYIQPEVERDTIPQVQSKQVLERETSELQAEKSTEIEDILKLLEAEIVPKSREIDVAEPPIIAPEEISLVQPPEIVGKPADQQTVIAELPQLILDDISVVQPLDSVVQHQESIVQPRDKQVVDEGVEKSAEQFVGKDKEKKDLEEASRKKELDKEKRPKKRGDVKKRENLIKRRAAIQFLTMSHKKPHKKINFASFQQKLSVIYADVKLTKKKDIPPCVPFYNVTGVNALLDEFWQVDIMEKEVVREGRPSRRTSSVEPPTLQRGSTPSAILSVSGEVQRVSRVADISTPMLEPSPALTAAAVSMSPIQHISSTPIKRAADITLEKPSPTKRGRLYQRIDVSTPELEGIVETEQKEKTSDEQLPPELPIQIVQQPPEQTIEILQPPPEPTIEVVQPSVEPAVPSSVVIQPTIIEEIEQIHPVEEERRVRRAPVEKEAELSKEKRHQEIINIISKWNFSEGELYIQEICLQLCLKPTKLIMARLFSDMLSNDFKICIKSFDLLTWNLFHAQLFKMFIKVIKYHRVV